MDEEGGKQQVVKKKKKKNHKTAGSPQLWATLMTSRCALVLHV